MSYLKFLSAFLLFCLAACGGGSKSSATANTANTANQAPVSVISGFTVDDYVVGGNVRLFDDTGTLVASVKTVDFGYFEFVNIAPGDYRIVISGGVQDADGLAATTADQKTNTAVLSGMSVAADRDRVLLISAVTTGVDQFAAGNVEKYRQKANAFEALLPNSVYVASGKDNATSALKAIAVVTEAAGGFTKLVREIADDGEINASKSVDPSVMSQAIEVASATRSSGFSDPALLACFLDALSERPSQFTNILFESVTELYCSGSGISSLSGLERLTNLRIASFAQNKLASIAPLSVLNKLESVNLTDNYISVLDLTRTVPVGLSVAGNCLPFNALLPANVSATGILRRQKNGAACRLPQLKNLRAIYYQGKGVSVSYSVQDAQSMTCTLATGAGTQRVVAKCDGDAHVIHGLSVPNFSLGTSTVAIFVDQVQLGAVKIEPSSFPTSQRAASTPAFVTSTLGYAENEVRPVRIEVGFNVDMQIDLLPPNNPTIEVLPFASSSTTEYSWSSTRPRTFQVRLERSAVPRTVIFKASTFKSKSGASPVSDFTINVPISPPLVETSRGCSATSPVASQVYFSKALKPDGSPPPGAVYPFSYSIVNLGKTPAQDVIVSVTAPDGSLATFNAGTVYGCGNFISLQTPDGRSPFSYVIPGSASGTSLAFEATISTSTPNAILSSKPFVFTVAVP